MIVTKDIPAIFQPSRQPSARFSSFVLFFFSHLILTPDAVTRFNDGRIDATAAAVDSSHGLLFRRYVHKKIVR